MHPSQESGENLMVDFVRAERLSLKAHPELDEKWVQDLIAKDPSILGLGDLELRQKERIQPRGGRLDLLLQDAEDRRYEVELQLGSTDETHIIRTIEYWDIERKRYPQYDHCAVLVAEDITSRFLNVISLFNGTIPLIAIQMQAFQVAGNLTLIFTKVMDELSRGLVDEDEEAEALPADRAYWEERASKASLVMVDQLFELVKQQDPKLELKYNKYYIGLTRDGASFNFVQFRPQKSTVLFEVQLPKTSDIDAQIEQTGLEALQYSRWGRYRLRISAGELKEKAEALRELIKLAYERRAA
jgi:predicted transport protein